MSFSFIKLHLCQVPRDNSVSLTFSLDHKFKISNPILVFTQIIIERLDFVQFMSHQLSGSLLCLPPDQGAPAVSALGTGLRDLQGDSLLGGFCGLNAAPLMQAMLWHFLSSPPRHAILAPCFPALSSADSPYWRSSPFQIFLQKRLNIAPAWPSLLSGSYQAHREQALVSHRDSLGVLAPSNAVAFIFYRQFIFIFLT